ncbi:conserved Plasmodium protein, unknown function [Plasmodium malariae]|uniref:Uncharacterized protein n=1 Tax=Plasmodium malariae TaxID=5858 RepID=A0A1A8W964_PLAMA|nr:conserved Plasmodium protein, unknown function [Plasmodium malariae]
MDNPEVDRKNAKEKKGKELLKERSEELKKRTNQNESKFRKFCGNTDFMLNVPNIDSNLKFLKYEVDNSILNFNYNTMILNEKIERLNDIERDVHIHMELPFLYSYNIQNNDDIKCWINAQNACEKEKDALAVSGNNSTSNCRSKNRSNGKSSSSSSSSSSDRGSSSNNNTIFLSDSKLKEISPYLPVVTNFEKDDLDLLIKTIPNYVRSVQNYLLANEEKKNGNHLEKKKNLSNDHSRGLTDSTNSKKDKKRLPYNQYFQHPLKKKAKIRKIYPVLPYISVWKNKYIQGIMEIESTYDNVKSKSGEDRKPLCNDNGKSSKGTKSSAPYGLLHLIEKTRDKRIYSLYKRHIMNNSNNNTFSSSGNDGNVLTFSKSIPDIYNMENFYDRGRGISREREYPIECCNDDEQNDIQRDTDKTSNECIGKIGNDVNSASSETNHDGSKTKKRISLSKFLIRKHILKLKNKVSAVSTMSAESHEKSKNKGDLLDTKSEGNNGKVITKNCKNVTFNEKYEYTLVEKKIDNENNAEEDLKIEGDLENISEILGENIQCFKYVRDYKSPSFDINEKDSLSYALSFSKKNLAFIFPTLSKKIIFSKTGQQKRKNYILLKE